LRVNALANPEVGKFVNEYFCSSFQKVATFKIVGGNKQGGNVATYFCAPDGRVLHCVAGPVNADQMLREARWVVETTKTAMKEAKNDGAKFKAIFRKSHAERLKNEHGLVVEAITYDPPIDMDEKGALTYNDPTGRPIAPKLPPPPVEGPDVTIRAKAQLAEAAKMAPTGGFGMIADRKGGRWRSARRAASTCCWRRTRCRRSRPCTAQSSRASSARRSRPSRSRSSPRSPGGKRSEGRVEK